MEGLAAGGVLSPRAALALGTAVVSDLWGRLQSFVSLSIVPRAWDTVPFRHPFLYDVALADPRVQLRHVVRGSAFAPGALFPVRRVGHSPLTASVATASGGGPLVRSHS